MDLVKIGLIFLAIIIVVQLNKPLYMAMLAGVVASLVLYKVPLSAYPEIAFESFFGKQTVTVVLAFYTITFLQRMLEKRGRLLLAERSISRIFNSRRINATVVPFIIGMLPSAGAVLIAAPIVVSAAGEYLDRDEITFVTSYYRHISEAFVPTYTAIILALALTGVSMAGFVLLMIPLVIVLFLLGYLFYVRKIPKGGYDIEGKVDYKAEWINVIRSMWQITLAVLLILIFKMPVHYAVVIVIVLNFFIDKFNFEEIKPFFLSALEWNLIFTTIAVMAFKNVLVYSGVIERLPSYFMNISLDPKIIYAIIFFLVTLIVGSKAAIVTVMPLAFGTIGETDIVYFTYLMAISYIAMQVSPSHVCLGIITEDQGTTFNGLVKKTMPVLISFVIIATVYWIVLEMVMS